MLVVTPARSARRLRKCNVLGCASALLFLLVGGCKSSESPANEVKKPSSVSAAETAIKPGKEAPVVTPKLERAPSTVPAPAPTSGHGARFGIGAPGFSAPPVDAAASKPAAPARAEALKQAQNLGAFSGSSVSGTAQGGGGYGVGIGTGQGRLAGSHATSAPKMYAPRRALAAPPAPPAVFNTENYAHVAENAFSNVADQPLSTFSVDVDTASYSNARRFLNDGTLPPKDSIRIEEWLNYFNYDYPEPVAEEPFSVTSEVSSCPWNGSHRLVRLGLKSQQISQAETPARNLVFLLDVSGSMMPADKLPLLKRGLSLLAENLRQKDTISIVVYAGASGLALPATSGANRARVLEALGRLEAGGSTNGGDGIRLAYATARQHLVKGGINRVLLATDGDFNVGTSSEGELQRLIEEERKSGVFLTVLGFGSGNVKDSAMEMLADKGNGNYAYIDSIAEARKVLVREAGSTLVTIAKDVKLQVEFNPTQVQSYKLIGYENRLLAKEDFNDDQKDAGEIGAGHAVTALYEVVPKGEKAAPPKVDPLKYQTAPAVSAAAASKEMLTVNIRYKQPTSDTSRKFSRVVVDGGLPLDKTSADFRFSAAVAEAALVLRGAPEIPGASLEAARNLAQGAIGSDVTGDRHEFVSLLTKARALAPSTATVVARAQ
ncbi:MAG TPA: VWA domain-containing protein [Polyangiaceae bacterium]|jgi:Ca-activated chloride channel family protein|nr:VWA domain-containing protein [Polyangiaceae bacterium]